MSDQTPQRDQPVREDRPVMGDHPDLETEDEFRPTYDESRDTLSRLLIPGIIVLAIVVIIIAYFIFFA